MTEPDRAPLVPTPSEVDAAIAALRGRVIETPLVAAPRLAAETGAARVHVKFETFQNTGSFKYRGALWRCSNLSDAERKAGVVAFSSGNFAQGLAAAATSLGIPSTIVMPIDAPDTKRRRTEGFGARVVLTEHGERPREEVASERARELARAEGMTLLHPFDDPLIIAGHASLAGEVARVLAADGEAMPDVVLCCVGGGGLLAGLALAFRRFSPDCEIVPVEPLQYDGLGRSWRAGQITPAEGGRSTICDALQARQPGVAPFACVKAAGLGDPLAVSDEEVRAAMALAFDQFKVVLEPSGAVALAGLLQQKERFAGRRVLVIASGGNISLAAFHAHLNA
ncbi:MAG: pyridoxal-phosphate dependent enzyme [Rhizobiales bacterium]|nr:pyridoxal-phosphate dependent enzyme [Hyphomicrobiales bacterium]